MNKKVLLMILDGWGYSEEKEHNGILNANTPNIDSISKRYPNALISASGEDVGLPANQMGNSEVGHLNIGAGRIIYQDIIRISKQIKDKSILKIKNFTDPIENVKSKKSKLHFIGLVSDGGVHSHIDHLFGLIDLALELGIDKESLIVDAITDGRDTPPDSAIKYISELEKFLDKKGRIGTVTGRFYMMDRDKRWERVEKGWKVLTSGSDKKFKKATDAVESSYADSVTDEFIEPSSILDSKGNPIVLSKNDGIIFFNFRADRAREISAALTDKSFNKFDKGSKGTFSLTCMTEYEKVLNLPVIFDQYNIDKTLGSIVSDNKLKQLRIAETEKYAHVTFFFNGGIEKPYPNEERILIPSPDVRTYDLKPEMSCPQVRDKLLENIESQKYDYITANIANPDMVGHTGVWEAALKAVEAVDEAVGRIVDAALKNHYSVIITADHGNIEKMVENGKPMTAHTTNKVPLYLLTEDNNIKIRSEGILADIAPTILRLMNIKQPKQMTGNSLIIQA